MGERFGKYELVRRIGVGGMAEVHVARTFGAAGFVKDVVIKRILPAFNADREFVDMFINEARVAARLHHTNIVQVIEFDQVDGVYYIAMEWVDGTDLRHIRSVARRRGLPVPQTLAVHVGVEALKGLHYAHGRIEQGRPLGLVHRDVSPHNLLLSFAGELKIADFGIAKVAALASVTRTGAVKGKLTYMAPEQLRGELIDQRTDLYALGIVLWELLSDRRLYSDTGSEGELVAAVRRGGAPPLCTVNPAVPVELGAVVDRLLAPRPDQRFASAAEALPALSSFASTGDALTVADYLHRLLPAEAERDQRGVTMPQGAVLTSDMPLAGPEAATRSAPSSAETGPPPPASPASRAGVLNAPPGSRGALSPAQSTADERHASSAGGAIEPTGGRSTTWRLARGPMAVAAVALFGVVLLSGWWLGAWLQRVSPASSPAVPPAAVAPATAVLVVTLDPPDGELQVDGVALGRRGRWSFSGQRGHRVSLVARWPQGTLRREVVFAADATALRLVPPHALAAPEPGVDGGAPARVVVPRPPLAPRALAVRRPGPHASQPAAAAAPATRARAPGARPLATTPGGGERVLRRSPSAPATLDVIVVPWARVLLDGRAVGTTPLTGLSVPAGAHLIELANDDLARHERVRLKLAAGGHHRLRRDWTPAASANP